MRQIIDDAIMYRAKRKVGFKIHLTIYLIMISINWMIWYFSKSTYVWPIWPTLGWGIGIFFHWRGVYHSDKFLLGNKEVQNLQSNESNNH